MEYEPNFLEIPVFAIYSDMALFGDDNGFFKIIRNDIANELVAILIIVGGIFVAFSKEKVEDEFIYKLRKDSLVWAFVVNYIILLLAVVFVYGLPFFHVVAFNMYTPIIFFVFRFTFMKIRSRSHEE